MLMKKSEIIEVLERNLETLKSSNIPEDLNMFHSFDTGGYGGDICEIYDFDINYVYDEEDNVLVLSYYGDENPGTKGVV